MGRPGAVGRHEGAIAVLAAMAVWQGLALLPVGAFFFRPPPLLAGDLVETTGTDIPLVRAGGELGKAHQPLIPVRGLLFHRKMDLRAISADDLEIIPGIGPKLASEIIRHREHFRGFGSWADVERVPGIGPKKLELLKEWTRLQ